MHSDNIIHVSVHVDRPIEITMRRFKVILEDCAFGVTSFLHNHAPF